MSDDYREELLPHYQRELDYLRRMGRAFGETYPKVAGRLEMGEGESADPHVERLIESFAFLTARIQQNIDAEFPKIPEALLGILYPQFTCPTPSMTIARLRPDPERGKLTGGHPIPRGTPLFATAPNGMTCRFRTGYPVTLWPLEVAEAGFQSTDGYDFLDHRPDVNAVLRLSIKTTDAAISELGLDRLRVHLNADRVTADTLYELLFVHARSVVLLPDGRRDRPIELGPAAIEPVGFEREDAVIDVPPHGQPAYHLLQEYFTIPEKFLFFDLAGLRPGDARQRLDILILLDKAPKRRLSIDAETFALHCTPVVNLFRKTSEPVRIDGRQSEYRLVADRRRERITEIHSILDVTASNLPEADAYRVEPFFSYSHGASQTRGGQGAHAFWYARRDATSRGDLRGTDMWISFLDLDWRPAKPAATTLYAHTLCTNRGLAEQLQAGALLQIEESAPLAGIDVLYKPTRQLNPPLGGETLWRLVSHLSLNYLSLSQFEGSLKALQEILRLYARTGDPAVEQQINGIVRMECRRAVRRLGPEAWRGFARGVDVNLTFDEGAYVGSSAILLASVLNRFLGLYASINSFAQLTARSQQREGIWKQWPPRAGDQFLL
ncbi:type VI secretion system baseplate subunit TssF [Marivibrio halodurans]|uniref:Type VI secretion system baseplate subunit TssF n=1 Tax=Marivibrio halodurans TaxID=2039722 RepID=A0A8J7V2I8_9PROT|nr:type VI secretion system baseplate subunit TssF [Marivibrio halodurans]MBP5857370.1 type VI secretion system baseplate subunit TssF [Marivibrio halodurans]